MDLILIRHTSVEVPTGYAYGQSDVPLKASFKTEALQVKAQLKDSAFDEIWSSPSSRCLRLAETCGYTDIQKDKRLMEINFGEWEMKSWQEIYADPRSKNWFKDWVHVAPPKGESCQQQYKRLQSFIEERKSYGVQRLLVFTHGGILALAKVLIGIYPLEEALRNIPPYGQLLRIKY